MIIVSLPMLSILSVLLISLLFGKDKEIVDYINRQQKEGHKKGKIRIKMEVEGYTSEMLNCYFDLADKELARKQALKVFAMIIIGVFLLGGVFVIGQNTGLTGAVTSTVTGAFSWRSLSPSSWFASYECGDDYPADADEVMDLSDCVNDTKATKNYLFCYINNTQNISKLSPRGVNDNWYWEHLEINLSALRDAGETTIDSMTLLKSSIVFPWTASTDDSVDCFSWDHGITRTKKWHLCNATTSDEELPSNLVFYYTDAITGDINDTYGGVSTELGVNSSYYLCYDELSCTTSTSACDESSGSYCVGRLRNITDGPWYSCDTTQSEAKYYRCCTGGCNAKEMECGEYVGADTRSAIEFDECSSDGTSGCCSSSTDCVYDNECYSEEEEITYTYTSLGASTGIGVDIESTTEEYTFVCSDAHWCPEGFEYLSDYQLCEPIQTACYDATNTDYCNYIFGTDSIDDWEVDTEGSKGCIAPSESGLGYYNQSCVYSGTYGGVDYYFYQDITGY